MISLWLLNRIYIGLKSDKKNQVLVLPRITPENSTSSQRSHGVNCSKSTTRAIIERKKKTVIDVSQ